MATGQLSVAIHQLCRSALPEGNLSDGQLLERFLVDGEETAFAALVQRHGAMVLGVCRRVLGNAHDAEDAFQATFLVLARKAASVQPRELVGNWLYGVAYRTALKAKTLAAKRRARERQMRDMPTTHEDADQAVWRDLQPLLDQELNRLAEKYRVPVVLCDLEGKSQREAARQLGWPEGTLFARLSRARQLLAKRLTQRGVALSAGTLAVLLSQQAVAASVPTALVGATVKAATLVAAGQAVTAVLSTQVVALTQGVLQAMFMTKIKNALTVLVAVALFGTGVGLLSHRGWAEDARSPEGVPAFGQRKAVESPKSSGGGRQGVRESGQKAATFVGKVTEVGKDGKTFTLESPGKTRGDGPTQHTIKLTDKTKILFSGVGPNGAKLGTGLMAQVWSAEGSKEVAVSVHFQGKENIRPAADVIGKVMSVSKDGATISLEMPGRGREENPKTVDIRLTNKTVQRYSFIDKDGAKPSEGYMVHIWLASGSKDTAARAEFTGMVSRGERGEAQKRLDLQSKLVEASKDGKTLTVLVAPAARGEEPTKQNIQVDDKTQVTYLNVGLKGARFTEGQQLHVWLVEGSKEKAAKVMVQGTEPEAKMLRGKVVEAAKDGKSVTLEMSAMERGGDATKTTFKITDKTRVVYQGVGPDGARLTNGYIAVVRLEDGLKDTAAQLILVGEGSVGGGRR